MIEASVNGGAPHLYVLDTGTTGLVLSRKLLPEIRPQALATTVSMDTVAGPQFLGSEYRIEAIRIGSAEFRGLTACSADLSNLEGSVGQELGGVLGITVFADCRLTIDYPTGAVLLEPSGTVHREESQGGSVLPLVLSAEGTPHISVDIQGSKVWTMIDSGWNGAFTMPGRLLQKLHVNSPVRVYASNATFHGSVPIYAARLPGSILLADHEFVRPIVQVLDHQPLLGHEALKHFRVSIDLQKKQAFFARAEDGPVGPPPAVRHPGFFCAPVGDRLLVTESIKEMTLEQLGLREGDELLDVNGVRRSELSMGKLRELANAHDTLTLNIMRDNVKLSVNVPVTVLIP